MQRLEEKDIFVTQGDLMNLWFILSKRNNKSINKDEKDGKPARGDLNAMADMLLDSKNGNYLYDSLPVSMSYWFGSTWLKYCRNI